MHILHIAAPDIDKTQHRRLIKTVGALASLSLDQIVISSEEEKLADDLEALKVRHDIVKFGGLFDLRTKQHMEDLCRSFDPDIIHGHSLQSATLATRFFPDKVIVGYVSGRDKSTMKKLCTLAVEVTPQGKSSDPENLAAVPPFEKDREAAVKALLMAYQAALEKRSSGQ